MEKDEADTHGRSCPRVSLPDCKHVVSMRMKLRRHAMFSFSISNIENNNYTNEHAYLFFRVNN